MTDYYDSDFAFLPDHDGEVSVESAVFQALGAVSVCWDNPGGAGVFHSERAKEIGEHLLAFLGARHG